MNEKIFCCYCGRLIKSPLIKTSEHLVPKSKGGNNTHYNKRPCCSVCNKWRGNKPLENFKSEIKTLILKNQGYAGFSKYHLETILENIEYLQFYIQTAKDKLLTQRHTI
jgi:5-methylcytosine-specific restriction endonuclease McrA